VISTIDLLELKLRALDGDIGKVCDLVFHDNDWAIHGLIADTGGWPFGRKVGIDPDVLDEPDVAAGVLPLELTKDQVKDAPPFEPGALTSPSADVVAWNQSNALPGIPETVLLAGATVPTQPLTSEAPPGQHLRNLEDVLGSVITAGEEPTGRLAGFLIDPIAWDMPLALVELDAGGPAVLLPTRLIATVSWPERTLHTFIAADVLHNAPVYDPRVLDERIYLPAVADYYSACV
jgi:hypothetical protein